MIAPTLTGARVTLRHHVAADFDPLWAFFQSPRAQHIDPVNSKSDFWYGFGAEAGAWDLYGIGAWAIDVQDQLAGQVAILHPPHFPECEIGWILLDTFEGHGYAQEAATLALDWFWSNRDAETLVSYIDKNNLRSIALAERLGALPDPEARKYDEVDVVYRHRRPQ